jgi:hypothetical protein
VLRMEEERWPKQLYQPVEVGRSTSWRGDVKGALKFSFPSSYLLSPSCDICTISTIISLVFSLAPFACWTPTISPPQSPFHTHLHLPRFFFVLMTVNLPRLLVFITTVLPLLGLLTS